MKIGIDISQIVHEGTGVATYSRELVSHLLINNSQNKFLLFGQSLRKKSILEEFYSKVSTSNTQKSFWPIPPKVSNVLFNQLHLPIEYFTGSLDIFHSSDWTAPSSRSLKITTIHDLIIYKYPESSHPEIIAVQKKRLGWVKKECDLILADSQSTKKDIIEILGIKESKIRVIYLAASEQYSLWRNKSQEEIIREVQRVRSKYRLSRPYFLTVGTKEPRKNLIKLVEAFKNSKVIDCELVMVGKQGWGEANETSDLIKSVGYISQEDLPGLYAGALAYLYPSLYEGFGVPILEAMSCGCPVLTSNISSMPEVGGKAAIYVEPTKVTDIVDKLTYLANLSSAKRETLKDLGLRQAEKFSWKQTAMETLKSYEDLVG